MKNVYGLYNAMKVVESACEKGEITIIGEGGTPSPVELYAKCVNYINSRYGVDILNLVAKTATEKDKPCECGICHTVIIEEDEDDQIVIDIESAEAYLVVALADLMPYADKDYLSEAISNIIDNFESANDNDEVADMCAEDIIDIICDELCDKLDGVSLDSIKAVANVVGMHIEHHFVLM